MDALFVLAVGFQHAVHITWSIIDLISFDERGTGAPLLSLFFYDIGQVSVKVLKAKLSVTVYVTDSLQKILDLIKVIVNAGS